MAVRELHNRDWGLESSCFVCEPRNAGGLRVPFFHDTDAGFVFAEFQLNSTFSGAPSYLHGGVILSLLDEAMAWAVIAIEEQFAVTATMGSSFHRPVRVDHAYRVEGRVASVDAEACRTTAGIVDGRSRIRAEASATMTVLSPAQFLDAAGSELDSDRLGHYVRDDA